MTACLYAAGLDMSGGRHGVNSVLKLMGNSGIGIAYFKNLELEFATKTLFRVPTPSKPVLRSSWPHMR